MNSRGVTPLVATVLLVVVVVAIAALIYTWTIGFTGGTLGTAETTGRGMPGEARFVVESCTINSSASTITLVLRNMGTIDLTGFKVYAVSSTGATTDTNTYSGTSIAAGSSGVITMDYTTAPARVRVQSTQFPNLIVSRECY